MLYFFGKVEHMLQPVIMKLSSKGQVVIPAKFRKALNIKPHQSVMLIPKIADKEIILTSIEQSPIDALHGFLKGKTKKSLTKALLEDRKKDREMDEKQMKRYGF